MEIIIAIIIALALFAMLLTTFACMKVSSDADEFAEREYKRLMSERKIKTSQHM